MIFHVNSVPSRGLTRNPKSYFLWKTLKKYLWMSSAAVVIGALRVKTNDTVVEALMRQTTKHYLYLIYIWPHCFNIVMRCILLSYHILSYPTTFINISALHLNQWPKGTKWQRLIENRPAMAIMINHNRNTAMERSVIHYWKVKMAYTSYLYIWSITSSSKFLWISGPSCSKHR